ncbi:hypothetical protein P8935_17230 [Telmatobacter sp. DSM 110680]|uniref:Uncharacterized protein n=1 Tax=Telmatobacter sp. DSM 110680 TaxID=3036704 RepID=A0AAU7DF52_9BACT
MTIECEASPVADPTDSATANHAVDTCMEAWTRAYQSTIGNNRGRSFAAAEAADAYQRTLPTLIEWMVSAASSLAWRMEWQSAPSKAQLLLAFSTRHR